MSRLIREDFLMETIKRVCCHAEDETDLLNAVKQMPSVDAVEVVRCKDCKWWNTDWYKGEHGECPNVFCETTADWFCADGERKDDE